MALPIPIDQNTNEQAHQLLEILMSYRPANWSERETIFASNYLYQQSLADGGGSAQVKTLVQWLADGFMFGNWPWVVKNIPLRRG